MTADHAKCRRLAQGLGLLMVAGCAGLAARAPEAAAQPAEPVLVEGPGGVRLFPTGPADPRRAEIIFDQVASGSTEGAVLGSDDSFNPVRLPAAFKAEFSDGSLCTATLIGPRVLLTAAHCIDQKFPGNGVWHTTPGGIRLAGDTVPRLFKKCEMAPGYTADPPPEERTPRNSHDFALCEMASRVPVRAETIVPDAVALGTGEAILVAGFGCSEEDLKNGVIPENPGTSGKLRVGRNVLAPETVQGWVTLIGHVGTMEAIVCPGDSGGAAYSGATLTAGNDFGWRVAAVNSAVGPTIAQEARWREGASPSAGGAEYVSYLSPLSDPEFRRFLTGFMAVDPSLRAVCGVNRTWETENCRR